MSKINKERLKNRYTSSKSSGSKVKEINIHSHKQSRDTAMSSTGKPTNTKATISRLFKYLAKERKILIFALISCVIQSTSALIAAYLLRPVINKYIYFDPDISTLNQRMSNLIGGVIIMAIFYAVSLFLQWLQSRVMLKVSQKTLKKIFPLKLHLFSFFCRLFKYFCFIV